MKALNCYCLLLEAVPNIKSVKVKKAEEEKEDEAIIDNITTFQLLFFQESFVFFSFIEGKKSESEKTKKRRHM
jgi:hypothetical protein